MFFCIHWGGWGRRKVMELPRGGGGGGAAHKPGTTNNNDSAIKQHADTKEHEIHPSYMEIIIRK